MMDSAVSPPSPPPSPPPSSTLYQVRCKLPIHLHPSRLHAIEQGIHERLNTLLMHYDSDVSGVILSYSDIVLCDTSGHIFFERPYINFHILVSFVVFRVVTSQHVVGVVNKIGPDHVGLLIHGAFNAVIPQDQLPEYYYYHQQHHPIRIEMMVDERYTPRKNGSSQHTHTTTHPTHTTTPYTQTEQLSKKQLAKLKKLQEKEARRQAYELTHGKQTTEADNQDNSSTGLSDAQRMQYNIRVGSRLRFQVVSVHPSESSLSILGSLTADPTLQDTALINDDTGKQLLIAIGTDVEWEQKEQERLTQQEENDVAILFGVKPKQTHTHGPAEHTPNNIKPAITAHTPVHIDPAHISKKEQKALKKQQKADRKAAKAERKKEKQALSNYVHPHAETNHQHHTTDLITSNGIAPMSPVAAVDEKERKKKKEEKRKTAETPLAQPVEYANHDADDNDESNVVLNTPSSTIHPPPHSSSIKIKKRQHSTTDADSQLGAVKRKKSHNEAA